MHQILLPNYLNIGGGSIKKITDVLKSMNCKSPIIITDKTLVKLGALNSLEENLTSMQIRYTIFKDTIPEPTASSIKKGVLAIKNGKYDCIIAFGGGSPIDSAKAMSVLAKFGGSIKDYKFPNIVSKKGIPIIAIPTTAGTGSEVTKFTIITDDETDEKMLCVGPSFLPSAAIVDYELTLSVPKRTTADTAIDALTHAIEAYVSRKANTFSDTQAISAMKLIAPNLRRVYKNMNDKCAREKVMIGATLAGLAFSNSSVALVHGMSRPIGALFHVPHGLSNAMLLPSITEFSLKDASKKYSECAMAMGLANSNDSEENANAKLLEELYQLNIDLEVPTPEDYGIDKTAFKKHLNVMAEQALASGSPNNNPKIPSHNEIVKLYEQLWI